RRLSGAAREDGTLAMTQDKPSDCNRGSGALAAPSPQASARAAGPGWQPARPLPSRNLEPRSANDEVGPLTSSLVERASGLLLLAGFVSIGLTALLDYATGPELSLAIFYLLPIAAAAWWGGFAHGMLLSVTSVVAWHLVEVAERPGLHPGV